MAVWGLSLMLAADATAQVTFLKAFAPSEGFVAAAEKPARQEICLNGSWQFQPIAVPDGFRAGMGAPPELTPADPDKWEKVALKVPSPWNVNTWGNGRDAGESTRRPYVADSVYYPSYPASWDGARMGWLRREFAVPADWQDRRVVLHFEAVAGEAQVLVNGKAAGRHFDSFLPFEFDVTDLVKRDGPNELLVGVRKSSLFDQVSPDYPPGQRRTYPNGSNMDELVGIWQDVFLLGLPQVRVDDVFVQPQVDKQTLLVEVALRNDTGAAATVPVSAEAAPWINLAGQDVSSAAEPKGRLDAAVLKLAPRTVTVPAGGTAKVTLAAAVTGQLKPWSPDAPNLYGLTVRAGAADVKYTRFGWRQFSIKGADLTLNGQRLQLFADFSHPFGPYVGSRWYVTSFFAYIKSLGGNAVRPHAQPMPRFWLDVADEMGLCVLDEAAVFGSSINLNLKAPVTWERLTAHVDGLVLRDRNHASVFGWSPANEMFALFFKTDPAEKITQMTQLKQLAQRPRALDPTRDWISVDGDKDLDGTMPVWSRHFGVGLPDDLPGPTKPRMIGEHGGTYYAAPPRLRELAGDRPYESYAARNDILAADVYRMITKVAKPDLAFFSPSELAWFGLEHLPFGYRATDRPPGKEDGVFFPDYVEDTPGVQIERLPPYAMTINPGFDPALPMFKPLAMYPAMKAALDPRGPQPGPWDHLPTVTKQQQPVVTNSITKVGFVGDAAGPLFAALQAMGVPLVNGPQAAGASLLVVDGESATALAAGVAKAVWVRGGLVWVMCQEQGAALAQLGELLPTKVSVTKRTATALVKGASNPAVDGFNLSDLYFVGNDGEAPPIQRAGLEGPLVDAGRVLLSASNSDWTLFAHQSEAAKCSSMLIYEHLKKPAGAGLVETTVGEGKLWVSTLDPTPNGETYRAFWRQLWQNLGVKIDGLELNWLVQVGKESTWRYTTARPADGWEQPDFSDGSWKSGPAGFGTDVPNNRVNTPWETDDIYLRKNFSVTSLPRSLSLMIHHDEDAEVYLNGQKIFGEKGFLSDYRTVPLPAESRQALKTGANVVAVHCHQTAGGQYIDVGLAAGDLPGKAKRPHDLLLDGPLQD